MNRFKYEALAQEFTFLQECCGNRNAEDCEGIRVKRITLELLTSTYEAYSCVGSIVGVEHSHYLDFVLDDGSVIRDAVKCSGVHESNYAYQDTRYTEGESILEAIDRHGVADHLRYLVHTEVGFEVVDHFSTSKWRTVIYKSAKDFSLAEAIAEARAKAQAEVKAEAAF